MSVPHCTYCKKPVDAARDFAEVRGFERARREGGGTNAIRLRERTGVWACRFCVDREASGVSSRQGSLV